MLISLIEADVFPEIIFWVSVAYLFNTFVAHDADRAVRKLLEGTYDIWNL